MSSISARFQPLAAAYETAYKGNYHSENREHQDELYPAEDALLDLMQEYFGEQMVGFVTSSPYEIVAVRMRNGSLRSFNQLKQAFLGLEALPLLSICNRFQVNGDQIRSSTDQALLAHIERWVAPRKGVSEQIDRVAKEAINIAGQIANDELFMRCYCICRVRFSDLAFATELASPNYNFTLKLGDQRYEGASLLSFFNSHRLDPEVSR